MKRFINLERWSRAHALYLKRLVQINNTEEGKFALEGKCVFARMTREAIMNQPEPGPGSYIYKAIKTVVQEPI